MEPLGLPALIVLMSYRNISLIPGFSKCSFKFEYQWRFGISPYLSQPWSLPSWKCLKCCFMFLVSPRNQYPQWPQNLKVWRPSRMPIWPWILVNEWCTIMHQSFLINYYKINSGTITQIWSKSLINHKWYQKLFKSIN